MVLCGMNIHSGKFTRSIGLPMKNSITGGKPHLILIIIVLLTIIPSIGALVTYSPLLDKDGVSIKGIAMIN